jgi:hypothetical protein
VKKRTFRIFEILKSAKSDADDTIVVTFQNKKSLRVDKKTLFKIQRPNGEVNYAFNLNRGRGRGVYYISSGNDAIGPIYKFDHIKDSKPGSFFVCLNVKEFLPFARDKAKAFRQQDAAGSVQKLIDAGLDLVFVQVHHDGYYIQFEKTKILDALGNEDVMSSELLSPSKLKCAISEMYKGNPLKKIQSQSKEEFDAAELSEEAIVIPNENSILFCLK